ncbi:MAG: ATP-binding protein [Bacteroidales bacterium]|nr:ATP-binding protein [Bacteroidales bacterium]
MAISTNKGLPDGLGKHKEESIQSERLAFTGRIAASIAHEIRNPLGNVSMCVQLLRGAFTEDSPWVKHIDVIIRNTERINFLITELLSCARPPKLNIQPHDIHEILEGILDSIKTKSGSQHIVVSKGFNSQIPSINVDKEQIGRAFLNVAINAVESMPDGGKMTITTEIEGDFLVVKIKDSGEGIPEDDIIMIFDPFFSTKSSGTGLGLSTTYGIIASHDGTITVESERGNGTVFTISLPVR